MKKEQHEATPLALAQAAKLRTAIGLLESGFGEDIDLDDLSISASTLEALHARVQELEEFAKAVEQYGVLLRAGGAAPHDLEDLSAALAQCVELAQGVLK